MQNYLFINKNQENSRYYVILKGYRTFLNSTMKNLHSSHPRKLDGGKGKHVN